MVRFLHTGDWQLGMTRHFLSDEAQARFTQDRVDAIRRMGALAEAEGCEFVVVCGDVFESNQVDRKTVARAADALGSVPVPVYLLPGNHDPLDAASVFRTTAFTSATPEGVRVLMDSDPVEVRPGVELVGVPWTSRRPARDLTTVALDPLGPRSASLRVLVAHGSVDAEAPDHTDPALIYLAGLEAALEVGRIHYVALGDRHSVTEVGTSGRVWYAGSPEPTDYVEERPGHALVVDLSEEEVRVTPHAVGRWRFVRDSFSADTDEDLTRLESWLRDLPDKERTVLKLSFVGTLTLARKVRFDAILAGAADLFAAVEVWDRKTDLAVVPEDSDFLDFDLTGFAGDALDDLRARAESGDGTSQDALALLVRLAGSRR